MTARNVGIDLGYGFVKCRSATRQFVLPSVIGTARPLAYRSEISGYTAPEDNLLVETDGERHFVGSMAVRQSEVASRSLAEERTAGPAALVLFRTALALLAEPGTSAFHVVTGLPPLYFRSHQEALQGILRGEHRVALAGDGAPGERLLRVASVRVIPQPFGTLFDLLLDERGNPQNVDLAEARLGICDLGFRTADCVVADRLDYVDRHCFSTTVGMAAAYALVAQRLQREFGVTKADYELDGVIRAGRLRVGGRAHDVSAIRDEALQTVAEKVVTEMQSRWPVRDLDVIYLTGGGAEALSGALLDAFDTAVLADGAQQANARGYWKLANKLHGEAAALPSPNGHAVLPAERTEQGVPL